MAKDQSPIPEWMDSDEKLLNMPLFQTHEEAVEFIIKDLNSPNSKSIWHSYNVCKISALHHVYWENTNYEYPLKPYLNNN
jgi:hypothetical protein